MPRSASNSMTLAAASGWRNDQRTAGTITSGGQR
jgi:hypothetical protein